LSRSPFSRSSLSSFCRPCRSHRSIDLIHFARCNAPDKTLVKPVPDFYVRKTETSESIIIRSTIWYEYNNECCERVRPVSEVAGPNISSALSSSPISSKNYGTVRVPTLFSDMVPMNPAAGQLSPTSSAIARQPSGCEPSSSRLNQHEVCLSCRGTTAVRNFELQHEQAGYTLLIAQFRPRSDG
jgi:hypothetical protein